MTPPQPSREASRDETEQLISAILGKEKEPSLEINWSTIGSSWLPGRWMVEYSSLPRGKYSPLICRGDTLKECLQGVLAELSPAPLTVEED
jgi:hypothetical protein